MCKQTPVLHQLDAQARSQRSGACCLSPCPFVLGVVLALSRLCHVCDACLRLPCYLASVLHHVLSVGVPNYSSGGDGPRWWCLWVVFLPHVCSQHVADQCTCLGNLSGSVLAWVLQLAQLSRALFVCQWLHSYDTSKECLRH
jgi:hypothetical protein